MTRKMVSTRCNVKAVDHENIFYSHVNLYFHTRNNVFVYPYKEQRNGRKNVQHMDSDQNLT